MRENGVMLPIERRCQRRDTRAFVVPATVDALAEKLVGIIADRRMTTMRRYLGERAGTPRLVAGLRVWHGGFGDAVSLRPGQAVSVALANQAQHVESVAFSVGAQDETEADVGERYHHPETHWLGQREDITVVQFKGCPGEPGSADQIRVEHWNEHGIGHETLVVFDDLDPVEEIAWDVKGDREKRVQLWDEFCDVHGMHFEHPDHPRTGCQGRQSTLAENLAVLAYLASARQADAR